MSKKSNYLNFILISAIALAPIATNAAKIRTKGPSKIETTQVKKSSFYDPSLLNSKYASWGIRPGQNGSINLLNAWKKFNKKRDIIVAVVDTGIDESHPFLSDNLYVTSGNISKTNFGFDFSSAAKKSNKMKTPIDNHGHGTHVSGIIKSIFPDVKILPLKYYDPSASGKENLNSTISALEYAVKSNVDIINYSGGGPEPSPEELRILREAERKGIIVVAAAGNEQSNLDYKTMTGDLPNSYFPASYGLTNIITVTAHDRTKKILSSSNYGKLTVDISAPGHEINSARPSFGRSGLLTGTSQATAFVTGVVALIKSQYPEMSHSRIKEIIRNSAKQEITMSTKTISGGRLDAGKALELSGQKVNSNNVIALNSKLKRTPSEVAKKESGTILLRLKNTAAN